MNIEFVRERITKLRLDADISEHRLSLELGYSKSYIQSICSGRSSPSLQGLFEICDYFEVSVADFFDESNNTPKEIQEIVSKLSRLDREDLELIDLILGKYLEKK